MERIGLSAKQRRAIAALLTERSVTQAAAKAGVGQTTLFRWLAESDFRQALAEAEGLAIDEAVRALVRVAESAVGVLETTMQDPTAGAGVRVRAAQGVLDSLLRLREYRSLEERVSALERRGENERTH